MKKIKILAITGIRSEYDILYPVIKKMNDDERFEVVIAVSSAHLSDWHNFTVDKIENDGFKIVDKLDSLFMTSRNVQRAKGIGILTYALSQTVEREKPDFLFVIGDREESIATAIIGNYTNTLTIHLGGGDPVYGNADDPIRMAVSKLAHIHFTTTKEYANNLINNLHEDEFRVFFSGNPALSNVQNVEYISKEQISNFLKFDISTKKYIVLIKHPLSSEENSSYDQMKVTLEALEKFCLKYDFNVIGSFPNTDPGSYGILKAIKEYEDKIFINFFSNIPREYFINIMRNTELLVGNSSMGILEAPSYKIPVVNVGNRQKGRLNAGNVKFVNHKVDEIYSAIEEGCLNENYRKHVSNLISPYGNGDAPQIICNKILEIKPFDIKWLNKNNLC